jgi:hypothetical protein
MMPPSQPQHPGAQQFMFAQPQMRPPAFPPRYPPPPPTGSPGPVRPAAPVLRPAATEQQPEQQHDPEIQEEESEGEEEGSGPTFSQGLDNLRLQLEEQSLLPNAQVPVFFSPDAWPVEDHWKRDVLENIMQYPGQFKQVTEDQIRARWEKSGYQIDPDARLIALISQVEKVRKPRTVMNKDGTGVVLYERSYMDVSKAKAAHEAGEDWTRVLCVYTEHGVHTPLSWHKQWDRVSAADVTGTAKALRGGDLEWEGLVADLVTGKGKKKRQMSPSVEEMTPEPIRKSRSLPRTGRGGTQRASGRRSTAGRDVPSPQMASPSTPVTAGLPQTEAPAGDSSLALHELQQELWLERRARLGVESALAHASDPLLRVRTYVHSLEMAHSALVIAGSRAGHIDETANTAVQGAQARLQTEYRRMRAAYENALPGYNWSNI